jgi:hypothetical protein
MFCFRSSSRDRPKKPGKNQAAHPGPGSQVHPTASSRSPRRHACPAIFPAPQPTVLSQGPFWENAPQASNKFHLATGYRPQATGCHVVGDTVVPRSLWRRAAMAHTEKAKIRPPTQCWTARFTPQQEADTPPPIMSSNLFRVQPRQYCLRTISGKVTPQASHNPTQLPAPGHRLPYCCCWLC